MGAVAVDGWPLKKGGTPALISVTRTFAETQTASNRTVLIADDPWNAHNERHPRKIIKASKRGIHAGVDSHCKP